MPSTNPQPPTPKKRPQRKAEAKQAAKKPARGKPLTLVAFVIVLLVAGALLLSQKTTGQKALLSLRETLENVQSKTAELEESQRALEEEKQALEQKVGDTEKTLEETRELLAEQEVRAQRDAGKNNTARTWCADGPTKTDSGDVYPIHPQYAGLTFLGQLFTADDCGAKRFNAIFTSHDTQYTLASAVTLFSDAAPDEKLKTVFSSIGYACAEENPGDACQTWTLEKTIAIGTLLALKPHYTLFESDTCTNCGKAVPTTTVTGGATSTPLP